MINKSKEHRQSHTPKELAELFYTQGVISHIPTGRIRTAEEEAERLKVADLAGSVSGKPVSEIAIEDRGPY